MLVQVGPHGFEQEKLLLCERTVLPAAKQTEHPQRPPIVDHRVKQGIIDAIGLVALLIDRGMQSLLVLHQIALPKDGGLSAAAEPTGLIVVGIAHVVALGLDKLPRDAQGVQEKDSAAPLLAAQDAGVGRGDQQFQHRQEVLPQTFIIPAPIQFGYHLVINEKCVLFYHFLVLLYLESFLNATIMENKSKYHTSKYERILLFE